ncbi:MAG: type I glyceraldehyde-3-phosphate dehydrogenase [Acidimicrobiia bacterium]|nr:type I glyceraldehyde-3-phosphate dehydrogenase [Acidimicrobiia bacterium]
MTVRVGINGFGRIGRNFFRAAKDQGADIDFVAVNDLGSVETMAHLLKNDSVHGQLPQKIRATRSGINVDGDTLQVLSERDPESLPWGDLGVDVVIESTGIFTSKAAASKHRKAGAPKVIISAPSGDADATFVVGVNDDKYNPNTQHIISNASCTTNCFVPMIKVLDDAFGVEQGLMTTVHGYTGDQALVDGPHSDLRRARAAAVNIVPTSTGAARATGLVMRKMQGRLDGIAMRVPIPDGSMTDFVGVLRKNATAEQINAAFKAAATRGPLAKVLDYSDEPLVSSDIVGRPASCTFDSGLTMSQGTLVKVCGWYDNEMGYSHRLVDLALIVGKKKAKAKRGTKKTAAKKAPAKKTTAKRGAKKAPAKRGARRR